MKSSYWTTALHLKKFELVNVLPPQMKRRCTIYNENTLNLSMFVMNLKTLLSLTLIQLNFESIVATMICKISFQLVSSVEKEIVKSRFMDVKHLLSTKK